MRSTRVIAGLTLVLVAVASVAFAGLPPGGTFIDDDGHIFEGKRMAESGDNDIDGAVRLHRFAALFNVLLLGFAIWVMVARLGL